MREGTLSRRALGWCTILGFFDVVTALPFGNFVNLNPEDSAGFASMTELPLVLIPGFFVPAFTFLHLAAWMAFVEKGNICGPIAENRGTHGDLAAGGNVISDTRVAVNGRRSVICITVSGISPWIYSTGAYIELISEEILSEGE